jgi:hypothetical protein
MEDVLKNYPKVDGHIKNYVVYPEINKNKKWYAANVYLAGWGTPVGGYEGFNNHKQEFDTEEKCQKACDIHNRYHGWTPDQVDQIVHASMGL